MIDRTNSILAFVAMLNGNQSAEMACDLLAALYKLHCDTHLPGVTDEQFIELVTSGIREMAGEASHAAH